MIQKKSSKIEAYINFHKYIHLRTYNDEKKAAEAYNIKAIELFGEFAKINKLD